MHFQHILTLFQGSNSKMHFFTFGSQRQSKCILEFGALTSPSKSMATQDVEMPKRNRLYKPSSNVDKNNNSKSLPDLTGAEKLVISTPVERNGQETKSFSSRFVSHVKPDSVKVVRRKKSGLVDDHFEAIIPCQSTQEKKHEDSPPPCNCPRHSSRLPVRYKGTNLTIS